MAFALEHFPTFPYPPSGMQEVGEIERYLTSLHRSMQEFFSLLPRDIKDGISVVDLDDLANTTLADPDADRIVFWDDGAGVYTWLTANTGLAISTTNLNLSHLGLEALTDPGADRIFFWDDGETASKWLAPDGTSLEISGTTLRVVADGIDDTHIDWGTGTNQVSAVDMPIADAGSYYAGTEIEAALQEAMTELKVHQLTGFESASSVALSTDSGNPPTITLTFTGTVYWWSDGVRYSDSGTDALQIGNSSGTHIIYYNGATLSSQAAPSEAQMDALIRDKALVCIVYFNATTNASYVVANELHGAEMSGETHHWLHDNIGAKYKSGLTISGYTLDTATDAALTFEITDGEFYDEDLEFDIEDGSAANQYEQQLSGGDASIPVLYRNAGGEWTEQAASTLPYIVSGTTLRFMDADSSYTQTSIQNNYYMNMFLVATNDWQYPIKMIQGTDEYSKQEYSQGAAGDEMVDWSTLPSAEWILLYQIILKQSSGESVDGKIVDVIDFRFAGVTGASATSQDHGSLSGLSDNDHAQYVLHSLADAANDFLVASADDTFIKKTLAETGAILETDLDHGSIQGLDDNDHGAVYYTETEIDTWRSNVTQTEMSYLDGVTSDIQTQLDARCLESVFGTSIGAGLLLDGTVLKTDIELQAIAGLTSAADRYIRYTGSGTADLRTYANVLADLSGQAGAAFAWNSQNLTGVGTIASGNIGIGIAAPAAGIGIHMLKEASSGFTYTDVYSSGAAAHSPRIMWRRARDTIASPDAIQSGDIIGGMECQGYDGSAFKNAGRFRFIAQANPTDIGDIVPTYFAIQLCNTTGTTSERFRIRANGEMLLSALSTAALEITDAGTAGATEDGWIAIKIGAATHYIRTFTSI